MEKENKMKLLTAVTAWRWEPRGVLVFLIVLLTSTMATPALPSWTSTPPLDGWLIRGGEDDDVGGSVGAGTLSSFADVGTVGTLTSPIECATLQQAGLAINRGIPDGEWAPMGAHSTINFGETITGSIDAPAEMDTYTFTAEAGDVILLGMSRASGSLWPEIRLFDPDAALLRAESSTTHVEITNTLPAPGTYTVLVSDGFNGTLTGDYNLYLQSLSALLIDGSLAHETPRKWDMNQSG